MIWSLVLSGKTSNSRIKVAQVLYSGLGGHGSVVFSLLDADRGRQWEPILGFLGVESLNTGYKENCLKRGISFEHFQAIPGRPWLTWLGILHWLRRSKPDIVILHSITALLPCWWFARLTGCPLIAVEHTPNSLKRTSEWLATGLSMWLADKIVVLSKVYEVELEQKLGYLCRGSKIRIVPNGIDTTQYAMVSRGNEPAGKLIRLGMAARFTTAKRHDSLIEMMKLLRHQATNYNFQLILAGDGVTQRDIRGQIEAAGLSDCILLTGQLDGVALVEWFQSLDMYLHASEGETLSTALLQAMSTGLPIVASDVGGISNLLGGSPACGQLVVNSAPQGFADSVLNLLAYPDKAQILRHAAREKVLNEFGHDTMFARYCSILDESSKKFW
jgi:glycosyltransferase involved in cell wall biosynthesis